MKSLYNLKKRVLGGISPLIRRIKKGEGVPGGESGRCNYVRLSPWNKKNNQFTLINSHNLKLKKFKSSFGSVELSFDHFSLWDLIHIMKSEKKKVKKSKKKY